MLNSRRLVAAGFLVVAMLTGDVGSSTISVDAAGPRGAMPQSPPAMPAIVSSPEPAVNLVAAENGGHVISATDELEDYPATNLIDGCKVDLCEWWTEEVTFPQVVVFAFYGEQVRTIDRVVLNPWTSEYRWSWVKDFQIFVSETSTNYRQMDRVGAFTLERLGIDQEFTFEPVRAKYVALVVRSSYGNPEGIALNEFEVYAAPDKGGNVPASSGTPAPSTAKRIDAGLESHGTEAGGGSDRIDVDVEVTDIIPSVYHLYGQYFNDMTRVTLTNNNPFPVKVRVEAGIPDYTTSSVQTVTLEPDEESTVALNPPFNMGIYEKLTETKNPTVHIVVDYLKEGEKRLVDEESVPLKIWSQGDVFWHAPGFYNPFLFAATLVTPNDPALDRLIRNAADYAPGGIIRMGYGQPGDKDGRLYGTLKAFYRAVADDGVIYVATDAEFLSASDRREGLGLQRIKVPYQVIATHSGMCFELALLFASFAERIGLDPVIITVPSHVFMAVPVAQGSAKYYVIETTLVGRASFEEAINTGSGEFNAALSEIEKDELDDYNWLDVSDMRREEIVPIPWR